MAETKEQTKEAATKDVVRILDNVPAAVQNKATEWQGILSGPDAAATLFASVGKGLDNTATAALVLGARGVQGEADRLTGGVALAVAAVQATHSDWTLTDVGDLFGVGKARAGQYSQQGTAALVLQRFGVLDSDTMRIVRDVTTGKGAAQLREAIKASVPDEIKGTPGSKAHTARMAKVGKELHAAVLAVPATVAALPPGNRGTTGKAAGGRKVPGTTDPTGKTEGTASSAPAPADDLGILTRGIACLVEAASAVSGRGHLASDVNRQQAAAAIKEIQAALRQRKAPASKAS